MNQFTASLWGDEAFAAVLAQKSPIQIVSIVARDTSPPLYYLVEHFWMKAFGIGEVSIRALSFVLFLLMVFFVYKIGTHLWDKKTGLIAATLTFLNPFLFIYAFEGRMYSILAASVAASMYFFIKKSWVPYVVATAAALYSHHFAIFAVSVQGLWFLKEFFFGQKAVATKMFKSLIAVGLLYLPWLYPLYLQTTLVGSGFWLATPRPNDVWNLFRTFLAEAVDHRLTQPAFVFLAATLLLRRWQKDFEESVFLALWFILPIILTFLASQFFQSIFFDRYLLFSIPGVLLLLASNRRRVSALALGAGILSLVLVTSFYFTHPTKKPFSELADYVKQTSQEGDFLINHNAAAHHLWESKYYGLDAPLWVPEGQLPFYVGTALMGKEDIIKDLPEADRVGVITSGALEEVEIAGYTRSKTSQFSSLKFAWYERE